MQSLTFASGDTELHNTPLSVAQPEGWSRTIMAADKLRPDSRGIGMPTKLNGRVDISKK